MTKNNQRIGDYISLVDERNTDGSITNLMGISIDKCYIPSVANVIGTDLRNYKIIRKGQFACSLMQVSRDQKIPLAMFTSNEPAIMSPAYVLFEVKRSDELLPEYIDLWFKRVEFDREASFYAVGGVRGSLDWEDFCNMRFPIPSIDEQRKVVHAYQVISDRIALLNRINDNLETTGLSLFKHYFLDYVPYSSSITEDNNMHYPAGWKSLSLEDICLKITDGSHYSPVETESSIYPMLSVKDMGKYDFNYSSCKKMDEKDFIKMQQSDCVPQVDDILIAKDGSYLKEVFIVNKLRKQGILSSIAIFRANRDVIYPEILLYLLKSPSILREVKENYVTGSAITRIVLKNFKKLRLIIPPLKEQEKLLPLFTQIRTTIQNNCDEIAVLKELSKNHLGLL